MTGKEQLGEPEAGRWQDLSGRFNIEYAPDVMEELRALVQDGFQRIPHGGIEAGGILYGKFEGETTKILEWRRILCDHAAGPTFNLSGQDRERLTEQLSRPGLELGGLEPVGWFASHSRSGLKLKPVDLELHNAFFPHARQAILLLQAVRDGSTNGAFFVREADGTLAAEPRVEPFSIRPNALLIGSVRPTSARVEAEIEAPPQRRGRTRWEKIPASVPPAPPSPIASVQDSQAPEDTHVEAPEMALPKFAQALPPPPSRLLNRFLLIAALCAVSAGVVIAVPRLIPAEKAALALQATEVRGPSAPQLLFRWELNAPAFQTAERASLEVIDGLTTKMIELDSDEIQRGSLTYVRQSGDVQVRMTVFRRNEEPFQELARYIGPDVNSETAPAAVERPVKSDSERLSAETETLRQEQAKTRRLEQSVATIKTRLEQESVRIP